MTKTGEPLIRKEETALAVRLDPQALIRAAVESGAGLDTIERLVALAKDVRAEAAREAWHVAMSEFQRTCPPVRRTKLNRAFGTRYAPLDEITRTVFPVMGPLGLSVGFRVQHEPDRIGANCIVSHEMGHHEESGMVYMPISSAELDPSTKREKGANSAQRVGIAQSYAKRYAMLAVLGLSPEDDPDAEVPRTEERAAAAPRRKSESAPTSRTEDGGLRVEGAIESVEEFSGRKSGGGTWVRWGFTVGGLQIGTFSESVADVARSFAGTGELVRVGYEMSKDGKFRNALGIEALVQPED